MSHDHSPAFRRRGVATVTLACIIASLVALGAGSAHAAKAKTPDCTVRFQDAGPQMALYDRWLALSEGYFEDEGVTVEVNAPIFNGSQIIQSLITGSADVSGAGTTGILSLDQAGQGDKIVPFGVTSNSVQQSISVTPDALAKLKAKGITKDSPPLKKIKALKGMTIASFAAGSLTDTFLRIGLESGGLNPTNDVTIQPFPDNNAVLAAAREGKVDAVSGSASLIAPLEVDGTAEILLNYSEIPKVAKLPFVSLAASADYANQHPACLTAFLKAINRAHETIQKGLTDEQFNKLRSTYFPQTVPNALRQGMALANPTFSTTSYIPTTQEMKRLIAAYNLTAQVPYSGSTTIFDPKFAKGVSVAGAKTATTTTQP